MPAVPLPHLRPLRNNVTQASHLRQSCLYWEGKRKKKPSATTQTSRPYAQTEQIAVHQHCFCGSSLFNTTNFFIIKASFCRKQPKPRLSFEFLSLVVAFTESLHQFTPLPGLTLPHTRNCYHTGFLPLSLVSARDFPVIMWPSGHTVTTPQLTHLCCL